MNGGEDAKERGDIDLIGVTGRDESGGDEGGNGEDGHSISSGSRLGSLSLVRDGKLLDSSHIAELRWSGDAVSTREVEGSSGTFLSSSCESRTSAGDDARLVE